MDSENVLLRKDAPLESQWDVEHVFASWDDWQAEFAAVKEVIPQLRSYAGRLGEGPAVLAEWLTVAHQLRRRALRLRLYPYMHTVVNSRDTQAKGNLGQVMGLLAELRAAAAFALHGSGAVGLEGR